MQGSGLDTMLVGHLLCGIVVGWSAATWAVLSGFSVAESLVIHYFGSYVGFAAAFLIAAGPLGRFSAGRRS